VKSSFSPFTTDSNAEALTATHLQATMKTLFSPMEV